LLNISSDAVEHATFADLKDYLRPGDVLAVNTSATVAAALCARRADGLRLEIHLSTQLPAGLWSVELRAPNGGASRPYEEHYSVGEATALSINTARRHGGRIIAVGTTVVRALESVVGGDGRVHPGSGWTRLVIDGQQPLSAVDALLTGLHEPRATHLAMLRALAGEEHLRHAYAEAVGAGYLWHEFGDSHLILP
jgi:S-adenosylmethionine:tRNA-ribosyltransferase-isomerase (queuine synthetase)